MADLATQLNFSVYRDTVRRLAWEGGMAWVEAMDARSHSVEQRGGKGGLKGVNEACDAALGALTLFLAGFKDPRFPQQPLGRWGSSGTNQEVLEEDATPVSLEEEEQWAMAHFFCARALFRRTAHSTGERREDARRCLERVTWFLQAVGKLGKSARLRLEDCVRVGKDLVEVLPQKIAVLDKMS